MRTLRTALAVLALAAVSIAVPAAANAAPAKTPIQLGVHWGG
jgi:hypothetical protein